MLRFIMFPTYPLYQVVQDIKYKKMDFFFLIQSQLKILLIGEFLFSTPN